MSAEQIASAGSTGQSNAAIFSPEADRDEEVLPPSDLPADLVLDGLLGGVHGVLAAAVDPLQRLLHQVQSDAQGVPAV